MLKDVIPGEMRHPIYVVFAFIGLVIGSIQVGYGAADLGHPAWLTVAWSVYGYVSAGVGFTAAANTDKAPKPPKANVKP